MAPMDKVGFVKTFREEIRSVCDVAIRLFGGFKEVETLFFTETRHGLDKFHRSISNSFKAVRDLSVPAVKRNE
jgi:hypothetical protein|tara:strand:- start:36579 stop:36797 length:219 start_codon:yes stop_codon:yes gene_type:complete